MRVAFGDWLPPSPNPPHNIHDLGVVPLGVDGVGDLGAGVTEGELGGFVTELFAGQRPGVV